MAIGWYTNSGSIIVQELPWAQGSVLRFRWEVDASSHKACAAVPLPIRGALVEVVANHFRTGATGITYSVGLYDQLGRDVFGGLCTGFAVNSTVQKTLYQPVIVGVQGRNQYGPLVILPPFSTRMYIEDSGGVAEVGVLDLYIQEV